MNILKNIGEYNAFWEEAKTEKKKIGFVPTMGALHDGHLSLIQYSKANNDLTVASIFVNPKQFNLDSDYRGYPRDLNKDIQLLESEGCDALFTPSELEMHPKLGDSKYLYWQDKTKDVNLGSLATVMEGKYRPGHFDGVMDIVQKLFYITRPDSAYFGEKDYQQLAVIYRMTEQLDLKIDIVGCPIVRENDGLAMSSRNTLLSKAQRNASVIINTTLVASQAKVHNKPVAELCDWIKEEINGEALCELQYVEIVDSVELTPVSEWEPSKKLTCCVAVFMDSVRLIDNISLIP